MSLFLEIYFKVLKIKDNNEIIIEIFNNFLILI